MTWTIGETLPGGGIITSVSDDYIGVEYSGYSFSFDRAQFERGIAYVVQLLMTAAGQ